MCLRDVLSQMKANFFAALTLGSKMSEKKNEVWSGLNLHFQVKPFLSQPFSLFKHSSIKNPEDLTKS